MNLANIAGKTPGDETKWPNNLNSPVAPTGTLSGTSPGVPLTMPLGTSMLAKPGTVGGLTTAGTSTGVPGFCPYSIIHMITSVNSTSC